MAVCAAKEVDLHPGATPGSKAKQKDGNVLETACGMGKCPQGWDSLGENHFVSDGTWFIDVYLCGR